MRIFGYGGAVALAATFLIGCVSQNADVVRDAESADSMIVGVPADFGGRYLVALSDTDTLASAYVDDIIGDPVDAEDTFSVIGLGDENFVSEITVSNSVWAPPTIAVSPDGTVAYVLEIREQREPDDETFEEDLAFSTRMSVVDLSDPENPSLVDVVDIGGFAGHYVDINGRGDTLAITNWAPDAQLIILPVNGTSIGEPQRFSLGIENDFAFPNTVEWHPDDQTLGVIVGPLNLAAFYRVTESGAGEFGVSPLGRPVPLGLFPFTAFWTPDGDEFVVAEMNWNLALGITDFNNSAGSLSVVRPDLDGSANFFHTVVPGPAVPANPEGLAISPQGDIAISVNLERSHLPENPSGASLSLMVYDEDLARLSWLADYPIDGILPEGIVFDSSGNYIAVTVFDQFDTEDAGVGRIEFWRVVRSPESGVSLERTDYQVMTPRGVHTLALIQ